VTVLPEVLRPIQDWRFTFFGVVLIVLAAVRPGGLLRAALPVR
jgi:hypothetical protein